MNILITGVNGLLGHELAKQFCALPGATVYGLAIGENIINKPGYVHIQADLTADFLDKLPPGIDVICHLAQSPHFREFPQKASHVFEVNVKSTQYLLDFAVKNGTKKFIYTSSGGVYGMGHEAFSEEFTIRHGNDLGYYLTTKLMGELLVKNYSNILTSIVVRPFFIYGVRQQRSMLIPRLVDNIRNKKTITLFGEEGLSLNPIHVSDAAKSLIELSKSDKSCVVNLAGTETYTLKQIVKLIGELLGIEPVIEYQKGEKNNLIGEIYQLKQFVNTNDFVSLKAGLKELL